MSGLEVPMCEYGRTEKMVNIQTQINRVYAGFRSMEDFVSYFICFFYKKNLFPDTEHIIIILYAFAKFGREKRITYHNCIKNF